MTDQIVDILPASNLVEMVEATINKEYLYTAVEIDEESVTMDGVEKTIAYGGGRFSTIVEPDDEPGIEYENKLFDFEINMATHKDEILVFDQLEVIIEVYDDE